MELKTGITVTSNQTLPELIKVYATRFWNWLNYRKDGLFWGSRMFFAIMIVSAVVVLITFIICKVKSHERKRIKTAAIDRLRDEALADALVKNDEPDDEPYEVPEPFLLKTFPKKKVYTVLQINEFSELSKREHIIPIDESVTIGRNDTCSISMRDRFVADNHCEIRRDGRKLYIVATQDEHPTHMRGFFKIIELEKDKPYRMRNGAKLQIGISLFVIKHMRFRITGGYL